MEMLQARKERVERRAERRKMVFLPCSPDS